MSLFFHIFVIIGIRAETARKGMHNNRTDCFNTPDFMAGIYIHIPFCKSKCHYCDFYSCTLLAKKEAVLAAVADELACRAGFLQGEPVRTVYVGGGTPSLCTPSELGALIGRIRDVYDVSGLQEVTVEANPDDLTADWLTALRVEGVNRLSIGIQSFIDRDLRWMHRRHDAASAVRAVGEAQRAGFENLTVDLIYGIPQMSLAEWEQNLGQAIRLGVQHISAYHLSVEPGTVFGKRLRRGALREIDPERSVAQYRLLHEMLTGAGFEHYEISNFARTGFRSQHNGNYWNGTRYLGVGPSAHSFDGALRQWNAADVRLYLEREPRQEHFESETLSEHAAYNEFVMTSLRTASGLDADVLERRFGARKLQYFTRLAVKFLAEGTLVRTGSAYRIPFEHYLISDTVISDLFYVE